jgi:hypothetical protein
MEEQATDKAAAVSLPLAFVALAIQGLVVACDDGHGIG